MSWRASPIDPRFPLSARGAFFLCVSALALLAGILRLDLAALFWGSAFLLLCLYGLVAGTAFRLLIRRAVRSSPDFLSVLLSPRDLSAGEEGTATVRVGLPRAFLPGFTARLSVPLSWHGRRIEVCTPLVPGSNACQAAFRAPRRGIYECVEAAIELRDVLGLTRARIRVPLAESVRVAPVLCAGADPEDRRAEGGDAVRVASRRRRSEELLETRKYVPGDDPRRMNWKLYAHMQELFLRVGEETPPPDSRLLFYLDATANPRVPAAAAEGYLDGMVEACGAAVLAATRRGTAALFAHSGSRASVAFGEEEASDLRAALAGIWWTPPAALEGLPGGRSMHAVVFSSPGSPALEGILAAMAARGWGISLLLKDLGEPAAPPSRPRSAGAMLRGLLFLPATVGAVPGAVPDAVPDATMGAVPRGEAASFRGQLAIEAARFRGPPWRLSDVRSV